MQNENKFIAHPTTIEQLNALEAVAKALKIKFEIKKTEKQYNPEFVKMILQGDEDFKNGKGKKMTSEELGELLGTSEVLKTSDV